MDARRQFSIILVFVLTLSSFLSAQEWVTSAFFYIEGIEGPDEGGFQVYEFRENVYRPFDEDNHHLGPVAGDAVMIRIYTNPASVRLREACSTGQNLPEASLLFRHINQTGQEEDYFQIAFRDVYIHRLLDYFSGTAGTNEHFEDIYMVYEEIEWENLVSHTRYSYGFLEKTKLDIDTDRYTLMSINDENGAPIEGPEPDGRFFVHDFRYTDFYNRFFQWELLTTEIAKDVDQATPILHQKLCEARELDQVRLSFFRFNTDIEEYEEYYRLILERVSIQKDSLCFIRENLDEDYYLHEIIRFFPGYWYWYDPISGYTYPGGGSAIRMDKELSIQKFNSFNFPNPFNSSTSLFFTLPQGFENEKVRLVIYDVRGCLIKELLNDYVQKTTHMVSWDARDTRGIEVPSGLYLYRISAGARSESGKLMLMR